MFENTCNHKIMILVKRIFAPDICLWLRSLLRFFCETGPRHLSILMLRTYSRAKVRGGVDNFGRQLGESADVQQNALKMAPQSGWITAAQWMPGREIHAIHYRHSVNMNHCCSMDAWQRDSCYTLQTLCQHESLLLNGCLAERFMLYITDTLSTWITAAQWMPGREIHAIHYRHSVNMNHCCSMVAWQRDSCYTLQTLCQHESLLLNGCLAERFMLYITDTLSTWITTTQWMPGREIHAIHYRHSVNMNHCYSMDAWQRDSCYTLQTLCQHESLLLNGCLAERFMLYITDTLSTWITATQWMPDREIHAIHYRHSVNMHHCCSMDAWQRFMLYITDTLSTWITAAQWMPGKEIHAVHYRHSVNMNHCYSMDAWQRDSCYTLQTLCQHESLLLNGCLAERFMLYITDTLSTWITATQWMPGREIHAIHYRHSVNMNHCCSMNAWQRDSCYTLQTLCQH